MLVPSERMLRTARRKSAGRSAGSHRVSNVCSRVGAREHQVGRDVRPVGEQHAGDRDAVAGAAA